MLSSTFLHCIYALLSIFCALVFSLSIPLRPDNQDDSSYHVSKDTTVLILGGGVAGIIAARTLLEQGISDFLIVEAGHELGGRMKSRTFGASSGTYTIETGANWVQGYGPENPIHTLATKYGLNTSLNAYFDNVSTYDETGQVDFKEEVGAAVNAYSTLVVSAGERLKKDMHDASARTGYSITGSKPLTPHQMASEYHAFDFEYAQTPEETSWIASSWAYNYTFDVHAGGFSNENHLCIDQRGFKTIIQQEANEFLDIGRVMLDSTVKKISYSPSGGVEVTLADGSRPLTADYAIVTFSLGVLQNDDVQFEPILPPWKLEGIHSMRMATFTKIFIQFPYKFWFDTEMGLYADSERGRYPVWQSLDHPNFLPGSGILFAVVTGDFSQRIESLSNAQVQAEVMSTLEKMFPHVAQGGIPEPLDFYFERWHQDRLFRGSYSNWPASFFDEHHDSLRAPVGGSRVWFAGEHTSKNYFGFLHGAYFEGVNVGMELSKCIRGSCST